jgi:hypothetical protein
LESRTVISFCGRQPHSSIIFKQTVFANRFFTTIPISELAAVKRIGGVVELVLLVHAFYCGAIWAHVVVAS